LKAPGTRISYLEAAKTGAPRKTTPTGLQETLETLTKVMADLITVTRLGQRHDSGGLSGAQIKKHGEKPKSGNVKYRKEKIRC